jgi:hypothetical protein
MALAQALAYVTRVLHSRENAKVLIRAQLERAGLATRAERLHIWESSIFADASFLVRNDCPPVADCEVPPQAWEYADVDWEKSSFVRRPLAIPPTADRLGRDLLGYRAWTVRVSVAQIKSLWPDKRSGRPHNTGYADADDPVLQKMHELLSKDVVGSRSAAAKRFLSEVLGASDEAKCKRLVDRYKLTYGE